MTYYNIRPALRVKGELGIRCKYMRNPTLIGYKCTYILNCDMKVKNEFCGKSPALENLAKSIKDVNELAFLCEVVEGKGVYQNKWHLNDVFEHTCKVVRILEELGADKTLLVSGWLHDIGKPVVATPELDKNGNQVFSPDGKLYHNFHGHEVVGKRMVEELDDELFKRLGVNKFTVAQIVGAHYLPMTFAKRMKKEPEKFSQLLLALKWRINKLSTNKEYVLDLFYAGILSKENTMDKKFLLALRNYLRGEIGLEVLRTEFEKICEVRLCQS